MDSSSTSASEWSSGCESGWTHYLDESFHSPNHHQRGSRASVYNQEESCKASHDDEDEEDLSMVSDASSGPPHHFCYEQEQDGGIECFRKPGFSSSSSSSKQKPKRNKAKDLYLEDTASSPASSCPNAKSYMDSSSNQQYLIHGIEQGSSAFGNEFGFWQISNSKRLDSAEPSVICRGRRRGG